MTKNDLRSGWKITYRNGQSKLVHRGDPDGIGRARFSTLGDYSFDFWEADMKHIKDKQYDIVEVVDELDKLLYKE